MTSTARDLAVHLARQIQANPDFAYLLGPGSRTWELLVEAISSITGEKSSDADMRLRAAVATAQAGQPMILRAAYDAYNLADWISYHYENGDMSHVDFRVEAKLQADSVIAKAAGEK